MRIGIDARMLGSENGGLGRYVEQLVGKLLEIDQANQYVLFLRKENFDKISMNTNHVQKMLVDIPWYSVAEQLHFPAIIRNAKVDLMHFPHWNVPLLYRGPFVLTIHDLIMYHYPRPEATTLGPMTYFFKDSMHRFVLRSAARRAKHIFVTSECTKQDVHETLGVPLEKMTVTYQAPFVQNFNNQDTCLPDRQARNKQIPSSKFQITKPYVLYVGSAYPHKNLDGLLKAWQIFQEKYGTDYQLVLVGKDSPFYRRLFASNIVNNVTHLTTVSDAYLVELYRHAALYVFPSLYEGFGLPPLEAMAAGAPVASSNRTCLPEVLGEAALYFDPENIEQMADVMNAGLRNEDIRSTLRQNAKNELKKYSLDRLARHTLEKYLG